MIFGSRMTSIFTGMLFLVMVTGWLSPARYGLWEALTDIVTFACYPAGILAFWATRDIARGSLQGRTLIFANMGLSLAGLGLFALFSLPGLSQLSGSLGSLALAAILVPLGYWNQGAASIAIGFRPAAMGYSLLLSEVAKLAVAYPALYLFKLELNGVLLALIASYAVQTLVITAMTRGALVAKADSSVGRRWLSNPWIPALYLISPQLQIADTWVAFVIAGGLLTGYYQAAFALGTLVSYAGLLASALYPMLIKGGREDAPGMTLDLILMFAIPMAVGEMALAPHLLALLNPTYVAPTADMSSVVVILAGWGFLGALSLFADNTLIGSERIDAGDRKGLREYLRSSFVYVATVNFAYLGAILAGVVTVVYIGTASGLPILQVVQAWASVQFLFTVPAIFLKLRKVRSKVHVGFPRALPYYVIAAAIMAAVLLALSSLGPDSDAGKLAIGRWVIEMLVLGAGVYFGLLLALNRETRTMASRLLFIAGIRSDAPEAQPKAAP